MSEQNKTQQKLIESWELIQGLEDNLKTCEKELEVTEKKLVEAEARLERLKVWIRKSAHRRNKLLSESPSDALRAYEQERFRERTDGVLMAFNEASTATTLSRMWALDEALTALKKERGEANAQPTAKTPSSLKARRSD